MGADVAETPASPGLLGVGPPGGLLMTRRLQLLGEPVLRILDLDEADLAEGAIGNELPCVPHHGVAATVIR